MLEDLRDYGLIKQRTVSTVDFFLAMLLTSWAPLLWDPVLAAGDFEEVQSDPPSHDADVVLTAPSHVHR